MAAAAAVAIGVVTAAFLAGNGSANRPPSAAGRPSGIPRTAAQEIRRSALKVRGSHIVSANGQIVRLTGFNNSGAEYACSEGWGIFDTPSGTVTSAMVNAMKAWTGANAVRLPVNEHCWLGLPDIPTAYSGLNYQHALERYVSGPRGCSTQHRCS